MVIGVPRETHRHEHRVGLMRRGAAVLTQAGHSVVVESGAGLGAHLSDDDFREAGAQIVYSSEEAYKRADLVCRVGLLATDELELLRPGSIICAFHHLAVAPRDKVERLLGLEVTLIAYELIHDRRGELPVLAPLSELAGQMAVHIAAHYLQNESGGRGILLGHAVGVPPPTVLVLGAGSVGSAAARAALAAGAHVIVADLDLGKLTTLHREFSGQVATAVAASNVLERYTAIADVLIGAVAIPGSRAPFVVTEQMVKGMKPGSVVIDVSIDQGGCVETSRPTTLDNPTFVAHGVVHYCVPNMTANIARTTSRALTNASLPYVAALADKGLERSLQDEPGLAQGVCLYRGRLIHPTIGEALDMPVVALAEAIREDTAS